MAMNTLCDISLMRKTYCPQLTLLSIKGRRNVSFPFKFMVPGSLWYRHTHINKNNERTPLSPTSLFCLFILYLLWDPVITETPCRGKILDLKQLGCFPQFAPITFQPLANCCILLDIQRHNLETRSAVPKEDSNMYTITKKAFTLVLVY